MERLTKIAEKGFAVDGVRAPKGDALIGWMIEDEDGWREVVVVEGDIVTTMDKHGNEREEDLERVRRIASPPITDLEQEADFESSVARLTKDERKQAWMDLRAQKQREFRARYDVDSYLTTDFNLAEAEED